MQVDFFDPAYMYSTDANNFGICDDQNMTPAYINETDTDKWIADVRNSSNNMVAFYPIDNCIDTLRSDGTMDNRCDGMLQYNNRLIFLELKDRDCQGWVADGLKQLKVSIGHFEKAHPDILKASIIRAQLCNKQRPRAVVVCNTDRARFKDQTGYIVEINRVIIIE